MTLQRVSPPLRALGGIEELDKSKRFGKKKTKMKFNQLKSNLSWSPEKPREAGRDGAGERALKNRLIKVQQS